MIEIVVLYILNKYDSTIYRVVKLIDEFFFAYLKTSTGSVSPALKRLEKIGCVTCSDKMSDGGMLSKIFSITPTGKKHLSDLLISFKEENPYHIVNEAKLLLYCCDVLSINETIEFKENLLNLLTLHKIKLEKGLENEYISLNSTQKETIKITLSEVEKLIELL